MAGLFARMVVAVTARMPRWFVGWVSRRYVAGATIEDAVKVMKRLSSESACFTIDVLGEEISEISEAEFFTDEYHRLIEAIIENKLDANLSIKPTAFGLLVDREKGMENIQALVESAAEYDIFVRLDMEDHRVTDDTIQVVIDMHERGFKNIGTVLQGRLFRTPGDIEKIKQKLGLNADYRICKGIYLEPEEIAHTSRKAIIDSTNLCIDQMLDAGAYVAIASHDYPVINHTLESLKTRGFTPTGPDPRFEVMSERVGKGPGYEFQMLLGVRGPLRRKLSKQGHRTRIYIPYGEKWYEYSMRRLRENPAVAIQIVKAIFMPWSNRP